MKYNSSSILNNSTDKKSKVCSQFPFSMFVSLACDWSRFSADANVYCRIPFFWISLSLTESKPWLIILLIFSFAACLFVSPLSGSLWYLSWLLADVFGARPIDVFAYDSSMNVHHPLRVGFAIDANESDAKCNYAVLIWTLVSADFILINSHTGASTANWFFA